MSWRVCVWLPAVLAVWWPNISFPSQPCQHGPASPLQGNQSGVLKHILHQRSLFQNALLHILIDTHTHTRWFAHCHYVKCSLHHLWMRAAGFLWSPPIWQKLMLDWRRADEIRAITCTVSILWTPSSFLMASVSRADESCRSDTNGYSFCKAEAVYYCTVTFTHLTGAFIQSDVQCIQVISYIILHGNRWELNPWLWCDLSWATRTFILMLETWK